MVCTNKELRVRCLDMGHGHEQKRWFGEFRIWGIRALGVGVAVEVSS